MPGDARWLLSTTASALHAAQCLLQGDSPAEGTLAAALVSETSALALELDSLSLSPAEFFVHSVPLTARYDTPLQIATVSLAKLLGPDATDARDTLTRRITSLTLALNDASSGLLDELELRARPLRDQWEARGPGLLAMLRRLTEIDLVVESADVLMVQPVRGGAGEAYPHYNCLAMEAVLANPQPSLPEVVRLGWLWGQLQLELPKYQDHLGRTRLAQIGRLAIIPPTLAAAQEVELARLDLETIDLALQTWHCEPGVAEILLEWWTTFEVSHPAWGVALGALDRLLAES